MSEFQRIVTIIPAKPIAEQEAMKRKLQVAAYCRVSTEEEEQQSSYEAQCSYYTDKIMTNPEWTMAGIFADEGITGTSTKKREDFNRMIRKCKKGKINLILTKSISRFARNTLDTIKYTRMLRAKPIRNVGDITKLNGADLPPVDIITGGSPCQDLSVAGARAGLAGDRSGLFMEQIRVIKEMRAADIQRGRPTEYIRPRFGVWENVPGAFSSGTPKGEDFRIVLEEFLRINFDSIYVPRPYTGRWESSGRILLGTSFSLAWRVFDTQYWPGTPQRRRRIYLVVDFGGTTAPTILFDQESLPRDYSPCLRAGKAFTAPASAGT